MYGVNDQNNCNDLKNNSKPSQEDYEGRKRAIDFGLGRGYSGSQVEKEERKKHKICFKEKTKNRWRKSFFAPFSCDKYLLQAARHMAGIMQANFSGGPGK